VSGTTKFLLFGPVIEMCFSRIVTSMSRNVLVKAGRPRLVHPVRRTTLVLNLRTFRNYRHWIFPFEM